MLSSVFSSSLFGFLPFISLMSLKNCAFKTQSSIFRLSNLSSLAKSSSLWLPSFMALKQIFAPKTPFLSRYRF
ncbi:hypothetical protein CR66_09200 [Campylobacter mucosalis]|nr:hypothetical protein CR66_09200 [Campylobacter mucosalis]